MIRRIDHIGLVTADLQSAATGMESLNMTLAYEGLVDSYGVAVQFWEREPNHVPIELVAPARPDAAVHGHLTRRGPGLHHIAFEVDDVDAELDAMSARGAVLVDPVPCPGGRAGLRVAFIHLGPSTGLLVELVEYAKDAAV